MSQAVVRRPVAVRERLTRTVDQRLLLRFPGLARTGARQLDRLPPSSRLRKALLWRAARLGLEAFHRRDYDVILLSHHTECEYRPPREMIEAGLVQSSYRGAAGYRELMSDWSHAGELHLDDVELIDLGDRLVLLAALSLRWHRQADPPLSRSWASVTTRERGRTIREHYYWNHAEALAAVGLSERAMSPENVELVKQHYAALSRGNYAAVMDMYAEDFEQDLTRVDGEINRGKDAVSRAWVRWVAPWDEFCMQAEAVIDAGEQVLALVRQSGIGKQSGVPVKLDFGAVWTVSDGRLLKLVVYPRRSDAFAAVGLSERT